MKPATLVATIVMTLLSFAFIVVAADAIGPQEPDQPAAQNPSQPISRPAATTAPSAAPAQPIQLDVGSNLLGEARDRDAKRLSDLEAIAAGLVSYKEGRGSYPSTSGRIQTACVYQNLDKLCEIRDQVGRNRFMDVRGGSFGYWYSSNGGSFTLFASMEGQVSGGEPCPDDASVIQQPNVVCLGPPR